MNPTPKSHEQLAALAAHLHTQRAGILQAWRSSVDGDPELTAPTALPRAQFNDHIPRLLDALESRLQMGAPRQGSVAEEQRKEDSSGHGMQRWQQGYNLR